MKLRSSLNLLIFTLALTACATASTPTQAPPVPPTATPIIFPTDTPTALPTDTATPLPTSTPTPTASPTPTLFVLPGTPLPPPPAPIQVENAANVSALALWNEPAVVDMAWTPDGRLLAVANQETINLYDINSRQAIRTLYPSTRELVQIAFSPNGRWLVSGSRRGSMEEGFFSTLEIWVGPDWKPLGILYDVPLALSKLEFSPDSKTLALAFTSPVYEDNLIEFLSTINWQIIEQLQPGTVLDVAFSMGGRQIAVAPNRYAIRFWDFDEVDWIMTHHTSFTGAVTRMSFSPDTVSFGSAHYDGVIRLWDLATGAPLLLISTEEVVEDIDFSPDGRLLASGGSYQNAYVRLWDVSTGALLRTLEGHHDGVAQVLFSPDRQYLVSASYSGEIRLWGHRR
jgi:WD40 repeat protein